jgi:dolichyl-phosphate-mannose-protein mannosyltransferase
MQKTYLNHWIARILFLIMLPILVYTGTFYMHFSILNRSGPGDAQMSSLFQAGLQGIDFSSNPIGMRNFNIELAYGSEITIKNSGRGGSLLHSHVQKFPSGSGMQQVTCYSHKDDNNIWIVEKGAGASDPQAVEFVNDGDVIRLVHKSTKAYLRSHDFDAPITIEDQEVSCSDNSTASDAHVLWKVERVTDISGAKSSRIRSLSTKFKLRHVNSGCLLRARKVTLPEWGFKQTETTCQRNPNEKCPSNYWNIEKHVNPKCFL